MSSQLKQCFAHSTLLLCCIKSHSHGLQPVVSASKSLGRESRVSDASDNALPLASLHYQPGLPRKTLVTRIYEGDGCVLSWHRKNLSLMWGTQVKWCQWGMWLTDIKRKCVFPKTAGAEYHIEALLPHCERGAPCFSHSISANPLTNFWLSKPSAADGDETSVSQTCQTVSIHWALKMKAWRKNAEDRASDISKNHTRC